MVQWKNRKKIDESEINFEVLEELFEEMLSTFEEKELDFSKPLKLGFTVVLNPDGGLCIEEFGLLKEKKIKDQKKPLAEIMEFENEFLIVIEASKESLNNIDIRINKQRVLVANRDTNEILEKIELSSPISEGQIRTKFNNNILEVRLEKKKYLKKSKSNLKKN